MSDMGQERLLRDLLGNVSILQFRGDKHVSVNAIATDSRKVAAGSVFFAVDGMTVNGNLFIEQAIARGAVAIVSQSENKAIRQVPYVQVEDVREALAVAARLFYRLPDELMRVAAVTGTNGKSTVTSLMHYVLKCFQPAVGMLGTIHYDVGDRLLPGVKTTPDALELYSMMHQMQQAGCKELVMELTSHGAVQKRAYGLDLDIAVFTNLTQDHLDYHGSFESYFKAKKLIFDGGLGRLPRMAIINIDDPYGVTIAKELSGKTQLVTYSILQEADFFASAVKTDMDGCRFQLHHPGGVTAVQTSLIGAYNVSNLVAALAAIHGLGYSLDAAILALKRFPGVPGRLESIDAGQPFKVIVDFAHTDDALKNMLQAVRNITPGRVLTVFGCGGERDQDKRPKMMRMVQLLSDYAWATSDNPRREPVMSIFKDMEAGVIDADKVSFVDDRKEAIALACQAAQPGDAVVITGRGDEAFQKWGDAMMPFDDRTVVRSILENMEHHAAL